MDRWLGEIVALLRGEDRELRRSAARVLGALKPGEPEVVQSLGEALASEDRALRSACLGAIEAIGGNGAFEAVAGLLDAEGEVGRRAGEVLVGMGTPALTRLKRRFERAGATARRRMLAVAVRLGGAAAIDLLLRALETGHSQEVLELGTRLSGELAKVKTRDRTTLVRRIDKFLASDRVGPEAAGAAVDLLARVLGEEAAPRLLAYAGPKGAPFVRRRALEALARMTTGTRLGPEEVGLLFGFLQEPDYTNVVAPAMQVLSRIKLSAAHASPLLSLVESHDPALRRFAVTALGQVDTTRSASALLLILQGDNPDLQKRAAEALRKQTAAIPLVVAALGAAPETQTAWVLARILHPHEHRLMPDQVQQLATAAARWLEPGDPRAEAVVSVLKERHLDRLAAAGLKRVKRLKRDRKAGEVVNLLRPLHREGPESSLEIRYELALAELVRGKKDVVRAVRLQNPGLQALEPLVHEEDFALLTKLKREKAVLTPEEFYLIGSHFAERPFADRAFGGEMLRWLVKTFPDDTSSQAAANKLIMEGFPPPAPPRRRAARKTAVKKKAAAPKKKVAPKKSAAARKKPVSKKTTAKKKKTAKKKTRR